MERMRASLPEWKPMVVAAQEATGIDWRLLAAIGYQGRVSVEANSSNLAADAPAALGFMKGFALVPAGR